MSPPLAVRPFRDLGARLSAEAQPFHAKGRLPRGLEGAVSVVMQVRDMMTARPSTIDIAETLGDAQRIMLRERLCNLPVLSAGRLVGILSERDLLASRARNPDEHAWWTIGVRDAMQVKPPTADPGDSLAATAARLAASPIGALPVVEHGALIGLITTRDVLVAELRAALSARRGPLVADAMTKAPVTVDPQTLVLDAIAKMVDRHVRHLPVVDASRVLLGMVSERDVRSTFGGMDETSAAEFGQLRVHEVMSRPARTARFDEPLSDAMHRLVDQRIGALAVVDGTEQLVGLLSYVDVLRVLAG